MGRTAQAGRVVWIGLRPERRADVVATKAATLATTGLEGDHAKAGQRAVTLIQAEHLPVIAALLGRSDVPPALLRRNIVVAGLNLLCFRKSVLTVGGALIRVSGPCPPCSRMEETLGFGGYTAMRGHGGIYAEVLEPGGVAIGDGVEPAAFQ